MSNAEHTERDYSLLRPFDLDGAKRGEAICFSSGAEITRFIDGPDSVGDLVFVVPGGQFYFAREKAIRMAPLCWVEGRPVYRGDVLYGKTSHMDYRATDAGFNPKNGFIMPLGNTDAITWTPPKVKREVKLLAYLDADQLFWLRETATPKWPSVRVPTEDKIIEIEEPAEVAK